MCNVPNISCKSYTYSIRLHLATGLAMDVCIEWVAYAAAAVAYPTNSQAFRDTQKMSSQQHIAALYKNGIPNSYKKKKKTFAGTHTHTPAMNNT